MIRKWFGIRGWLHIVWSGSALVMAACLICIWYGDRNSALPLGAAATAWLAFLGVELAWQTRQTDQQLARANARIRELEQQVAGINGGTSPRNATGTQEPRR